MKTHRAIAQYGNVNHGRQHSADANGLTPVTPITNQSQYSRPCGADDLDPNLGVFGVQNFQRDTLLPEHRSILSSCETVLASLTLLRAYQWHTTAAQTFPALAPPQTCWTVNTVQAQSNDTCSAVPKAEGCAASNTLPCRYAELEPDISHAELIRGCDTFIGDQRPCTHTGVLKLVK